MNFDVMWSSFPKLIQGIPTTLFLVSTSLAIGFVFAVVFAQMRLSKNAILSNLAVFYVFIFRSTPLLVQIFLIYYGSGQFRPFLQDVGLWQFFREPYFCAIAALTLNTGAYTCEIIRGGIQSVGWGQIEAGRAVGMSSFLLFRHCLSRRHPPGVAGLRKRSHPDHKIKFSRQHDHDLGNYGHREKNHRRDLCAHGSFHYFRGDLSCHEFHHHQGCRIRRKKIVSPALPKNHNKTETSRERGHRTLIYINGSI